MGNVQRLACDPLTNEERQRAGAAASAAWDLLVAGYKPGAAAGLLGISRMSVNAHAHRIRRIKEESGKRRRNVNTTAEDFEAECAADLAYELARRDRYSYMRPEDWQACTGCGLRGHQADGCDLLHMRDVIAGNRTNHDVGGEL